MIRAIRLLLVLAPLLGLAPGASAQTPDAPASDPFAALEPFVGRTWQGTFEAEGDGPASVDVSRWEWALGRRAVRITHSINDGVYGGETLIYWNGEANALEFVYVTTAGFATKGSFSVEGDTFTAHEVVSGHADGVTEVRSTGRLMPDGRMHSRAEYLRDGVWEPGHEVYYVEAPGAEVRFAAPDAQR